VTFSNITKTTIAGMALMAFAAAQTPPAAPAKKFKDDKEQTEAVGANTEKDPKAQIEKLEMWKHDYPETEYAVDRLGLYFSAYGTLKDFHNQIIIAQELRKTLPDNLQLLRTILVDFQQIKPPSDDDTAAGIDAARYIIDHADQVFAPGKAKENGMTDDQWKPLKAQMVEYAKTQLDTLAEAKGPDAVIARLKEDPTRVGLNGWLGKKILADAKDHPEKQSDAIFHYARAAAYTGPGCLDPKDRTGMKNFVDRAYKTYHGSLEGEDKLLATAANQPLPDGYVIKSTVDLAKEEAAADAEKRAANPMLAQWNDTKVILTADDGQAKFDSDIKDAALPKFKGKIISMKPALKPKMIVVAVAKEGVADCTLTFETALPGKMEPGEELEFEGVAKAFTKDPYMLTLAVDKDKLTGWTGKNAPAAPGAAKKKTGN
jgi:hypothetical protein